MKFAKGDRVRVRQELLDTTNGESLGVVDNPAFLYGMYPVLVIMTSGRSLTFREDELEHVD